MECLRAASSRLHHDDEDSQLDRLDGDKEATLAEERLCLKWLLTKCPAASADIRDNSPAKTVPQTMRAKLHAFWPGLVSCEPETKNAYYQS